MIKSSDFATYIMYAFYVGLENAEHLILNHKESPNQEIMEHMQNGEYVHYKQIPLLKKLGKENYEFKTAICSEKFLEALWASCQENKKAQNSVLDLVENSLVLATKQQHQILEKFYRAHGGKKVMEYIEMERLTEAPEPNPLTGAKGWFPNLPWRRSP